MIELTGLWERQDKNGNSVLSGYIGKAKLVIFKNTYKKTEKQPDYIAYISEKPKEQKTNDNIPF